MWECHHTHYWDSVGVSPYSLLRHQGVSLYSLLRHQGVSPYSLLRQCGSVTILTTETVWECHHTHYWDIRECHHTHCWYSVGVSPYSLLIQCGSVTILTADTAWECHHTHYWYSMGVSPYSLLIQHGSVTILTTETALECHHTHYWDSIGVSPYSLLRQRGSVTMLVLVCLRLPVRGTARSFFTFGAKSETQILPRASFMHDCSRKTRILVKHNRHNVSTVVQTCTWPTLRFSKYTKKKSHLRMSVTPSEVGSEGVI